MPQDNNKWKESWSSYWNQHQSWYQDHDPQWSSPEDWRQSSTAWCVAAVAAASAATAAAAAGKSAKRQGRYQGDSRHHWLESLDRPCGTKGVSAAPDRQRANDFRKESQAHTKVSNQRRYRRIPLARKGHGALVCANPQCTRPRQYEEGCDWDKCCKKCHTSKGLFHEEWCKGHWW